MHIQGDSGDINILRGDNIGHCDKTFIAICVQFLLFAEEKLFESPHPTPLDFFFWCWLKSGVHNRKMDTRENFGCYCLKK